MAEVVDLYVTT